MKDAHGSVLTFEWFVYVYVLLGTYVGIDGDNDT